ncbi:DUF4252 domain-containing protein [bacterium]|nr:DUF4252 domain-containing protein [bacterium]
MRQLFNIIFIIMIISINLPVHAQDYDYTKHPGYVNIDDIHISDDAGDVTEIDLGKGLLSLMNIFADDDDMAEIGEELGQLFSLRVKSFTLYDETDIRRMRKLIEKKDKRLKKDNWEPIIRTKSKNSITIICTKNVNKKSVGMFIMSLDEDGSVSFVNIVGGVDMNMISQMGIGLSDSTMRSLRKKIR